jgi:hypothetical protein
MSEQKEKIKSKRKSDSHNYYKAIAGKMKDQITELKLKYAWVREENSALINDLLDFHERLENSRKNQRTGNQEATFNN